ncbi:MAG: zinc ribbon domain-containing protein, partial [Christensenellales bacterium]
MDDYYFYKAIEIIRERGREFTEKRSVALRTDGGGLLTGIIYCAECGERLCINHCKKKRHTRDGEQAYHWNVYRCYRKTNSKNTCAG